MPQVGESKTINGVTGTWDGQTWRKVQSPDAASQVSAVDPGETDNPWLGRLKGFFQGAATGLPTAAKIVQVAAPFVTGGASIPIQAAVGGGTQILSDLADTASGDPNAPHNLMEALTRAAEGAAIPSAMSGVYRGVKALKPLISEGGAGGVTGGAMGAYEGYKRGGVMGAVEGGALGAMGGSALGSKFGKMMKGLGGEEAGAERAYGDAYKPRASSTVAGSEFREMPTTPAMEPQDATPSFYGTPSSPAVEAVAPENVGRFARGPRIESGMGSRTPEQAALYERGVAGDAMPRENLNEAINPTAVRPRSFDEPSAPAMPAAKTLDQSPALQGLAPSPRGTEMPLWSTDDATELPNNLQRDVLDLDQNYRRHTYDQRAPYLSGKR